MRFKFELYCDGRHEGSSHARHEGKFIGPFQRAAVVRAIQNDPNSTGTKVMLNVPNFDDEGDRLMRS